MLTADTDNSISQDETVVNSQSMQESENNADTDSEHEKKTAATKRRAEALKAYNDERVRIIKDNLTELGEDINSASEGTKKPSRLQEEFGIKSPFFRAWFGDWRANDNKTTIKNDNKTTIKVVDVNETIIPYDIQPKNIGIILRNKLKNNELFRGTVKNEDTGYNIQIGALGYNDTLTYAQRELRKDGVSAKEAVRRINILSKIDELIQNAVLLDTQVINDADNLNRSLMHSLYVTANVGEVYELIKIKVDELESPTNPTKRFYNLKDFEIINKKPLAANWDLNPSTDTSGGKDKVFAPISIVDLFNLVKKHDKEFKPSLQARWLLRCLPVLLQHGYVNKLLDKTSVFIYNDIYADSDERTSGTLVPAILYNMKLDVRKLLTGECERIPIDYTLESSVLPEFDDVIFEPEVHVSGELTNNGGYMRLALLCSIAYDAICARCLKAVNDTININFEKTVCEEGDLQNTDNDDYVEISDGMLDIDEALIEDMILNFPLKILCDEECKGLCPKCGIDLNTGSCSCITKEIDPRLAPLLKFFDNDDGES